MNATFTTHTKKIIRGKKLRNALAKVAEDLEKLGIRIYLDNDEHMKNAAEEYKRKTVLDYYSQAEDVRNGIIKSFSDWQRINTELTGECIALLPN